MVTWRTNRQPGIFPHICDVKGKKVVERTELSVGATHIELVGVTVIHYTKCLHVNSTPTIMTTSLLLRQRRTTA